MRLGLEKARQKEKGRVTYDPIASFRPRRVLPRNRTRKAILIVDAMGCRWTAVWTRKPHGRWECYETSEALSWMAGAEVRWAKDELERRQLKWWWK